MRINNDTYVDLMSKIAEVSENARLPLKSMFIDYRDILRQVLLHLPLYRNLEPSQDGRIDVRKHSKVIDNEIVRLAQMLISDRTQSDLNSLIPRGALCAVSDLHFGPVDDDIACSLFGTYHYLRSPRHDATSWGLFDPSHSSDIPVALASISPCDLYNLEPSLVRMGLGGLEEAVVLSRVLGTRELPTNVMSVLLSRVAQRIRGEWPTVRLLLTYLNTNVGFRGASLVAANWFVFARENKEHYLYENGQYKTERHFLAKYGTVNVESLRGMANVQHSQWALDPLHVFANPVRRSRLKSVSRTWSPVLVESAF